MESTQDKPGDLTYPKKEEKPWVKFAIVLGLILTTVVSTAVMAGLQNGWMIQGSLYDSINNARATTQLVVHIISGGLGTIHVVAVTQVINFASRRALMRKPASLGQLTLWNSLSTARLSWSVRGADLPLMVIFYIAALAPPALWAGALTPVPASTTVTKTAVSIRIPQYTNNSYGFWSQNDFYNESAADMNRKGSFSYLPLQHRLGYLITDGSRASSVDEQPQSYAKNDNSNYTFIGRSYGVGSSVGLTDDTIQTTNRTSGYQYLETGYYTMVECIYNSSSQWGLLLVQNGSGGQVWQTPFSYLATGPGPNTTIDPTCINGPLTDCPGIITAGLGGDEQIVAAGWWASAESGLADKGLPLPANYIGKTRPGLSKAFMALTAGSKYLNLNNTQCGISMIPTLFSIQVDVDNRKIYVSPQNKTNIKDIEPSGFVADSASAVLGIMSAIDPTLHEPLIGTILGRNIENILQQQNPTHTTSETTLGGIAESLQVLIDDYLIATASAQLMVANDSYIFSPTVSSKALSIGQKAYVIAIIAINAATIIVFFEEVVRTRSWKNLPTFNYSDVKSVIIASSLGGQDIAEAVLRRSNLVHNSIHDVPSPVKVMLRAEDGALKLVPSLHDMVVTSELTKLNKTRQSFDSELAEEV